LLLSNAQAFFIYSQAMIAKKKNHKVVLLQ